VKRVTCTWEPAHINDAGAFVPGQLLLTVGKKRVALDYQTAAEVRRVLRAASPDQLDLQMEATLEQFVQVGVRPSVAGPRLVVSAHVGDSRGRS
jgi:hypothetical protein